MMLARPSASALLSWRGLLSYGAASSVALLGVLLKAGLERRNYVLAGMWLSSTTACAFVVGNFLLFGVLSFGRVAQRTLFGDLRRSETDHLVEHVWYAVSNLFFILTLYPVELDFFLFALAGLSLLANVFHWLCEARIDSMGQMTVFPRFFYARLVATLGVLYAADMVHATCLTLSAVQNLGPGGIMVIFAIEAVSRVFDVGTYAVKFASNCYELHRGEPWEAKSRVVFFAEFTVEIANFCLYPIAYLLVFHYGRMGFNASLSVNMARDMFLIGSAIFKRVRDLLRYRAATTNMDARYPDATEDEVSALSDATCIICREDLAVDEDDPDKSNSVAKKLACGHIFHLRCLRSWLERQQRCPTCRRSVLDLSMPAEAGANPQPAPPAAADEPRAAHRPWTLHDFLQQRGLAPQRGQEPDGRAAGARPTPQLGNARAQDAQRSRETTRSLFAAAALDPGEAAHVAPAKQNDTPAELANPREAARRAVLNRFAHNRAPETLPGKAPRDAPPHEPIAPFDPAAPLDVGTVRARLDMPELALAHSRVSDTSHLSEDTDARLYERLQLLRDTQQTVEHAIAQVELALNREPEGKGKTRDEPDA